MSEEGTRRFRREGAVGAVVFPNAIYAAVCNEDDEAETIADQMGFAESVEQVVDMADTENTLVAVYQLQKLVRARRIISVTEEKNGGSKKRSKKRDEARSGETREN